jgi:WD40 repeat protein
MKRLPNTRQDWGPLLQALEGHTGLVVAIAFSKGGKVLASASYDCTVRLWDPTTGQCLQTLKGHTRAVNAIAFSKDGKMLASASPYDHTIRLWDLTTGQCLQTLEYTEEGNLSFSGNGWYLNVDGGNLILDSTASGAGHNPKQPPFVTCVKDSDQWVTHGMQKHLWLPPEYRNHRLAIHDNIIALGCASGEVIVLEFAFS